MWSFVAEDIFDAIGEGKHHARFYALLADALAIAACLLSLFIPCCHKIPSHMKLCGFALFGSICFAAMCVYGKYRRLSLLFLDVQVVQGPVPEARGSRPHYGSSEISQRHL